MEYVYQDEYEARINFEVLDELDPSMREKIDLDFLAHLTNTDPVLLAKYKVQPKPDSSRCSVADHDTTSQHFGSHLQLPLPPLSPAQNSLKGVCSLRRSSTVKPQSTTTPTHSCPVIKRVATFTDINDLLNKSLNKSQTGVTRPTGLLQSHDSISHRGSHPDTDGDHKPAEEVAQHLLRLLSAVKMSDQENEQGSNLTTSKPQP